MNEELKNVLIDNNVPVKEDKLIEDEIKVKKLTYLKLRMLFEGWACCC